MEAHLEHNQEDAKEALVHHVEVLSAAVTGVILDAVIVKMAMFLTIIMVMAMDVQIFMVKVLHLPSVTLAEVALDQIQELVVFQVVVVSSANPVYVDNQVKLVLVEVSVDVVLVLTVDLVPVLAVDLVQVPVMDTVLVLAVDMAPVLVVVVELIFVDLLHSNIDSDHKK